MRKRLNLWIIMTLNLAGLVASSTRGANPCAHGGWYYYFNPYPINDISLPYLPVSGTTPTNSCVGLWYTWGPSLTNYTAGTLLKQCSYCLFETNVVYTPLLTNWWEIYISAPYASPSSQGGTTAYFIPTRANDYTIRYVFRGFYADPLWTNQVACETPAFYIFEVHDMEPQFTPGQDRYLGDNTWVVGKQPNQNVTINAIPYPTPWSLSALPGSWTNAGTIPGVTIMDKLTAQVSLDYSGFYTNWVIAGTSYAQAMIEVIEPDLDVDSNLVLLGDRTRITLRGLPANAVGDVYVQLIFSSNKIKVYDAATGGNEVFTHSYFPFTSLPKYLWVEGVQASSSMNDVALILATDPSGVEDTQLLTVLAVDSVEWLDKNGNLITTFNDHPTAGIGVKYYSDAATATGDWEDKVRIKARLNVAVAGITVYLKDLDPDDPSANWDAVDADYVGPDNRGLSSHWNTSKATDSNGEVLFQGSESYQVSHQPGDNHRIAATLKSSELAKVTDANVSPDNEQMPSFYGRLSDLLTIWRKVYVEVDAMAAIPTDGNRVTGNIDGIDGNLTTKATKVNIDISLIWGLNPNDGSEGLDSGGNGRFENGTIWIGSSQVQTSDLLGNAELYLQTKNGSSFNLPFTVTKGNNSVGGQIISLSSNRFEVDQSLTPDLFNGGTLQVAGTTFSVQANSATLMTVSGTAQLSFILKDDDATTLPRNPDTSDLERAFKPAYVTPAYNLVNATPNPPFVANLRVHA